MKQSGIRRVGIKTWLGVSLAALLMASESPAAIPLTFGIEFLQPTADDRQLETTNVDVLYGIKSTKKPRFTFFAGITATRASGEITQLTGTLETETLREITYESSANGIGPNALVTLDVVRRKRFSVSLEASGGFIYYDRDFPAGGERYNFMWRIGPSIAYRIGESFTVGLGYRWMHVSNGKGVGPQNPSYDARGLRFQLFHAF